MQKCTRCNKEKSNDGYYKRLNGKQFSNCILCTDKKRRTYSRVSVKKEKTLDVFLTFAKEKLDSVRTKQDFEVFKEFINVPNIF